MVSSMFEVYVTTKVLQCALKLVSQSRLKNGDSLCSTSANDRGIFTMIAGPSEMINVMYNYEIN